MVDTFSPEKRSSIMRQVKGRDTNPELNVRRLVWALGFRYRLCAKDLPGKPDLVFRGRRKVVFVHGCFWHGHDCPRGSRIPATHQEYWRKKIAGNVARDAEHVAKLQQLGWQVLVVWECELKERAKLIISLKAFLTT